MGESSPADELARPTPIASWRVSWGYWLWSLQTALRRLMTVGLTLFGLGVGVASLVVPNLNLPPESSAEFSTRGWIGLGVGIASFIAGLAGSLAATSVQKWVDWRLRDDGALLRNHHLAELTGDVLRVLLLSTESRIAMPQDKRLARRLAGAVPTVWMTIAKESPPSEVFSNLRDRVLVEFVRDPDRGALNARAWRVLLIRANGGRDPEWVDDASYRCIVTALTVGFAGALREALKRDATLKGAAWAAIQLDIAGELLRSAPPLDRSDCEADEAVRALSGRAAAIESALAASLHEHREHDRVVRESFTVVQNQLTAIQGTVERIEDKVNLLVAREALAGFAIPVHKPPRNLPPRNGRFLGRTEELADLHARLSRSVAVGITQQVGVSAHGGIGKTELALAYAWSRYEAGAYAGGVFLIDGRSPSLVGAVAGLAPHLGLSSGEHENEVQLALRVKQTLETSERTSLLVIDDVPESACWGTGDWVDALPGGNRCRRLITTRAPSLADVEMRPLDALPIDDCVSLLSTYRSDASSEAHRAAAHRIVKWFGQVPVGVIAVGTFMAHHPERRWEEYADNLAQRGLAAIRETEQDIRTVHVGGERRERVLPYDKHLDAVFGDALGALPPQELAAMHVVAILPRGGAYRPWIEEALAHSAASDGGAARGALDRLLASKLMKVVAEDTSLLAIHDHLRAALQERLDPQTHERWDAAIGHVIGRAWERVRSAVLDPSSRVEIPPLVEVTAAWLGEQDGAQAIIMIAEAQSLASVLKELGMLSDALRLMTLSISIGEKELATDAPSLAVLYSNLATVEQAFGNMERARELVGKAVAIGEKQLPEDHPNLAVSYSNLALVEKELGHLPRARDLLGKVIAIEEKHFAADHPTLAVSYSNLATVEQALGDLPRARELLKKAIAIEETHFAADHPTLGVSYSNLATVEQDLGELPRARELLEKSIAIAEKHFAADHPTLAVSYSNLALVEKDLGDLPRARELLGKAITIEEKHFAADHPLLAVRYSNLSAVELALGNPERARELLRKAIAIGEKRLAADHPTLAKRYSSLSAVETALGDLPRARELLGMAIAIEEKCFAADHPDFAVLYANLATIEHALGNLPRARELIAKALPIASARLGESHPSTNLIRSLHERIHRAG